MKIKILQGNLRNQIPSALIPLSSFNVSDFASGNASFSSIAGVPLKEVTLSTDTGKGASPFQKCFNNPWTKNLYVRESTPMLDCRNSKSRALSSNVCFRSRSLRVASLFALTSILYRTGNYRFRVIYANPSVERAWNY